MSIIFTDSFDSYTFIPLKWDENTSNSCFSIESGVGRAGGQALTATAAFMRQDYDHMGKVFDEPLEEVILGLAFKKVYHDAGYLEIKFNNGEDTQSKLRLYNTSFVWLKGDDTLDYGLPRSLQYDEWNYVEIKLKTHTVSGTLDVRVNDYPAVSFTDISTATSTNYIDRIRFQSLHVLDTTGVSFYVDDLYIADTSGTYNNDFIGNCQISVIYPVSQAADSDFSLPPTVSGVENYTQVDDEIYPEDDTLYESYFLEYSGDDDGTQWWSGTTKTFTNNQTTMCHQDSYYDGSNYKNYFWWRFSNINIPRNAVITRAWLDVYLHGYAFTYDSNLYNHIFAYRSGTDPGKITALGQIESIPWTYNYHYNTGNAYIDGVSIVPIIQELVSRSDWDEEDNAILLVQRVYNSSGSENYGTLRYRAYEYYNDPANVNSPRLFVEWKLPGGDNNNYLSSINLGDKETYNFSALEAADEILAISHNIFSKRNLQTANTDDMSFRTLTTISGTTYSGTKNLPDDRKYTCCVVVDDVNPVTLAPWQPEDLPGTTFGYVTTTSG